MRDAPQHATSSKRFRQTVAVRQLGPVLQPGSAMAATPHLFKVSYNSLRDFAPVHQISDFSYVLVAHPSVPAKSARELIAMAKAKPGYLTYGSTGIGAPEALMTQAPVSIMACWPRQKMSS